MPLPRLYHSLIFTPVPNKTPGLSAVPNNSEIQLRYVELGTAMIGRLHLPVFNAIAISEMAVMVLPTPTSKEMQPELASSINATPSRCAGRNSKSPLLK